MENGILVRGRLTGPRSIELDEPVANVTTEVEVILRPKRESAPEDQGLAAFLSALPPGNRTREDIDQQLRQERAGWESGA